MGGIVLHAPGAGSPAAALAGGRTRHLPHGRRLCDRQSFDQFGRRDAHYDRPAPHGRSVCPGARADRRDSRPDPTGRRDARGHHRRLRGVPPLDSGRNHRDRLLHLVPAAREPHPPAVGLRADRTALATRGAHLRADRRRARRRAGCARRDSRCGFSAGDLPHWLRHRRGERPAGAT